MKVWILIIVAFLVYTNILGNGFVWDDEEQVVNNASIQSLGNIPAMFTASTFNSGGAGKLSGAYYKPLMPLTFTINYRLFGLSPGWFHLIQLLIHLGNIVLVFYILKSLFAREKITQKKSDWWAFWLALIFAIHPGISEAVVYVSAYQDVLFSFFGLLSFYILLFFEKNKNLNFLMLTFLCLFLSLLGKETGIIFIPLIALYLFLYNRKYLVNWLLGSLLILSLYLFLRLGIAKIGFGSPHIVPVARADFFTRVTTLPFELFSYLRLSLLPANLFISQHQIIKGFSLYFPAVFLFFLLIIYFYLKTKNKLFLFFFCLFIFFLGPTLNIIPADMTVSERWLYLSLIGFWGMVFVFLAYLKKIPQIIFILLVLLFSLRTFVRTFDWRSGLSLYQHDIKLNPAAFDLQNNYGVELFRSGDREKALEHFEKSIKLSPDWWTNYNNAGAVYQNQGNLEKAGKYYQKSIDNGDYFLAYENLANLILQTQGCPKALEFTQIALQKLPQNQQLNLIITWCKKT